MRIDCDDDCDAKHLFEFKDEANITYDDLQQNKNNNLDEIDALISKLNKQVYGIKSRKQNQKQKQKQQQNQKQKPHEISINIDTNDLIKINDNNLIKINDNDLIKINDNKERRIMKYIRWKDTEAIMAFVYMVLQSIIICLNSFEF